MVTIQETLPIFSSDEVRLVAFPEVCSYIRGITYSKAQEVNGLTDGCQRVLRANNITLATNTLNFDDVKCVSSDVKVKPVQMLKTGDILMCASSGSQEHVGKVAFIQENMDYTFGGFMAVIRCNEQALGKYIFYVLASSLFTDHLKDVLKSNTIKTINAEVMNSFVFPLPSMHIQEEIVQTLDEYSETNRQLILALETELKARRQQYSYYQESLFTLEDYEKRCIGAFASCYAGATPSTKKPSYWENGTIPWMSSGEVNLGEVNETEKYITQAGFDNSSTKMLPANTVVIALAGQGKTRGTVAITRIPLCTNQSLCGIVTDETVDSEYLLYYLKTQYRKLREISSGEGLRGGLNLKLISSFEVPVPSIDIQKRITKAASEYDSVFSRLNTEILKEIALRKNQYSFYMNRLMQYRID